MQSKILNQQIDNLSDLAFGSKSRKSTEQVTIVAALILSAASFATTYMGLNEFTANATLAALISFGMQGMMFTSSMLIADFLAENRLHKGFLSIYLITMATSVFFSFISLYSVIYQGEERQKREDIYFNTKVNEIKGNIKNDLNGTTPKGVDDYEKWKLGILDEANNLREKTESHKNKLLSEINNTRTKAILEEEKGSYVLDRNGNAIHTGSGYGYRTQQFELKLAELESKNKQLDSELQKQALALDTLKNHMIQFELEMSDMTLLTLLSNQCSIATKNSPNCSVSDLQVYQYIKQAKKASEDFNEACGFEGDISKNEAMKLMIKCISFSNITEEKKQSYTDELNETYINNNENTHKFITSMQGIINQDLLAFSALAIAIFIDFLILLCAFIRAKPTSFLNIENDDLDDMKEVAMECVLSCDHSALNTDSQNIARLKTILRILKFSLDISEKGYCGYILVSEVDEYTLHKELGLFFSLKLARPLKNKTIIGFRTRAILWMCSQIVAESRSDESKENVKHDTNIFTQFGRSA
ncbi:hypothetical protein JF50_02850 [Pseudoalteromonas luteoviolacea]|uniref:Uncharacterized protein n=1 Tax=Pseudoalteromonas luteoviolacea TaxID=43657 RepID=A0A0C1QDT6_9GAMM|nr:hypothetical protein [Pseudoalteromonas luteoviolacea]KID58811.1 hypothetical protein JF50_02850 [Pseudoalteromonas luteoviolacea]